MKKITLLIFLFISISSNAQYKTYFKNIFAKFSNHENIDGKLDVKIDSLLFSFEPDDENFWGFKVENNSKTKTSIDWQNATIVVGKEVSPIIFGTDSRLTMSQPKSPEVLLPDTYVKRQIDQKTNFENNYTSKLFYKKYIKDGYEWHVKITIPIIKNGASKEYFFDIIIYNDKN